MGFLPGTLHGYFFHKDFWPNSDFQLEHQIRLVLRLILRIRFLVPKIGSRRSYSPISRFRFCGENVGRSFVVFSHDPIFKTIEQRILNLAPKRSQGYHAKFVGAFHLSRRVSDENRACSTSIRFFKITDPCVRRSFSMCSHDLIFGTNKNRILRNGSCERGLYTWCPKKDATFLRKHETIAYVQLQE